MPASARGLKPHHLLLSLAALIATLPLILYGPSCGHDLDFHLVSWLEAAHQFRHFSFHPQWAFTPAWNAGEPRFIFYPPISWTLGGILALLFPLRSVPALYTWLALTASGLTMYRLSRRFATPKASLLAGSFYLANPYMLFTAYERTAYAELLAAAWIPLLLEAILRKELKPWRIAIPIALLWLTNAPAAVMSCYLLALITTVRVLQALLADRTHARRNARGAPSDATSASLAKDLNAPPASSFRIALVTFAGTLLGLGLSAFYLIPAACERRYVQIAMAIIPSLRIEDNTLFHHTGDPDRDAVIHTASLLALVLFAFTAAATVAARRHPSHRALAPSLLASLFFIAFLVTPASLPLWHHLPELAFLQFPWRTLALLTPLLGLAIALLFTPEHHLYDPLNPPVAQAAAQVFGRVLLAFALAGGLTLPAWYLFHQPCDLPFTQHLATLNSPRGTEPTDEYTPITADNDTLAQANPPFWFSSNPEAAAPTDLPPGPAPLHLDFTRSASQYLILNLRDYPAWAVTLNQAAVPAREQREDGLLTIPVPAGSNSLSIQWRTMPDHVLGFVLSLLSAALLFTFPRRRSVIIKP